MPYVKINGNHTHNTIHKVIFASASIIGLLAVTLVIALGIIVCGAMF